MGDDAKATDDENAVEGVVYGHEQRSENGREVSRRAPRRRKKQRSHAAEQTCPTRKAVGAQLRQLFLTTVHGGSATLP